MEYTLTTMDENVLRATQSFLDHVKKLQYDSNPLTHNGSVGHLIDVLN